MTIPFRVVDASGESVDSLTITVTNARTDEIYDVEQPLRYPGLYHALDDSFKERIRGFWGDPILVHGERDGYEFDAAFLIGVDEHDCHVVKLAGPNRVVITTVRAEAGVHCDYERVYLVRLRVTQYYLWAAGRTEGGVKGFDAAYANRLRTGGRTRSIED